MCCAQRQCRLGRECAAHLKVPLGRFEVLCTGAVGGLVLCGRADFGTGRRCINAGLPVLRIVGGQLPGLGSDSCLVPEILSCFRTRMSAAA